MTQAFPSDAQLRALKNLAGGLPVGFGLHGRSEHGGARKTRIALVNRGWMAADEDLTEAGREVLEAAASV